MPAWLLPELVAVLGARMVSQRANPLPLKLDRLHPDEACPKCLEPPCTSFVQQGTSGVADVDLCCAQIFSFSS